MTDESEMLIALAVSMEKERAVKIVDDVSNERIGGNTEASPTAFMAGYQTACEEILHRLKTEEWKYFGAVFGPEALAEDEAAR